MGERQRLGVQDALWLEMDKPDNLMVVDSLFWTAEPVDWERFAPCTPTTPSGCRPIPHIG